MPTLADLRIHAEALGIGIATYSPGDGATRYKIYSLDVGINSSSSLTLLGRKELFTALQAAEWFRWHGKEGGWRNA